MSGWAGGAAGVRGQERLTGEVSGREPLGKHSLLSQTQQRYERAGVRGRTSVRGKEEGNGEGSGPVGFHSVVICSSCFHTGGIVRPSVSLSGISLCVVQLIAAQTRKERKSSGS